MGGFCNRNSLLWDISCFKFVRSFPHNFQAAVRKKVVSRYSKFARGSVAFATHSAFVDVQSNPVGTKPLTVDSSLHCTLVRFLHTLCSFLSAMLCFWTPKPKTNERQKICAMGQHLKAIAGARHETHRGPYWKRAWADWDDSQQREASKLYLTGSYKHYILKYWEKVCPSINTLRDWGKNLATQGCTSRIGWLGKLTHKENTTLKTYFDDVRAEGAGVDRECIAIWQRNW